MLRYAALLALVAVAVATPVDNCSNAPAATYVNIPGCNSQPCQFVRGKDITADIGIAIDHKVTTLNTKVLATSLGLTIEYPLPDPNACNGLTNSACPLASGEEVNYHLEMPILTSYPKVKVDLEFSFLDQSKAVVACFKVTGQVVSA